MIPPRLHTIEEIFHAALDHEPHQVGAFLEAACEGDEVLRGQVEALLASHQRAGNFIEIPAAGMATRIIESGQADLLVGRTIGHYKISKRIGSGGMGEVYLATDLTAGRKAALKLLPLRFTGDAERLKRFQQEARAVVGLNHPNILTIYEVGEDHSVHYIASELIEGETLRQRLTRGRMGLSEAVDVAIEITSALAAAHEAGIVHRDIKPENIMLRPDGYVKVLDFGIAKLAEQEVPVTIPKDEALLLVETNLGSVLGTVRYMSPEQARGAPVDKRTDIWSLGIVLYEMITGHAPFTGDTPGEAMSSILEREPPPLRTSTAQTPAQLQQIVSRALNKEPKERYQSTRELLEALGSLRRGMEFKAELERSTAAPPRLRWARSPVTLVLIVLVAALALALPFSWHRKVRTHPPPEKSIAVLPFSNLSADQENAFFVEGMQDDILTALAKIAELKVIARTSVLSYPPGPTRDLREIGQMLGVSNILEGSVRRSGGKIRVTAQLIDTRTNTHVWAETYDREPADVFAIQSEIAQQIATALKAKLAPEEKARLDVRPTTNSEAYMLYLTALGRAGAVNSSTEDAMAAEQLYMQAVSLDPGFAQAYAQASIINSGVSSAMGGDYQARKTKARIQAEEALRLTPTSGEAHMAFGLCLYWGEKKYDAALREFEVAAAISPNHAKIYEYLAGIYRRQGRWHESIASFERALSLDPRNRTIAFLAGNHYLLLRNWKAAAACYNRAVEIAPDFVFPRIGLAYLEVCQNGDPAAGRKILENIPPTMARDERLNEARWDMAMLARDYVAAEKITIDSEDYSRAFYQGRVALARGDMDSAQRYFAAAAPDFEKRMRDNPDHPDPHAYLGLLYAYLQRKEDAIREARRAVEIEPESQNAFHGAIWAGNLALVYTLVGEGDRALTLIERLLSTPGPVQLADTRNITLAELRLRGEWDSLRSDPRFQKILAGPEPQTVLTKR
jgi:serine/threonine protein kinase/tetratricopeptide (TPR) repeat protein